MIKRRQGGCILVRVNTGKLVRHEIGDRQKPSNPKMSSISYVLTLPIFREGSEDLMSCSGTETILLHGAPCQSSARDRSSLI